MDAARVAVTVGITTCVLSNRQASSTAWAGKATGLCPPCEDMHVSVCWDACVCMCLCAYGSVRIRLHKLAGPGGDPASWLLSSQQAACSLVYFPGVCLSAPFLGGLVKQRPPTCLCLLAVCLAEALRIVVFQG